MFSQVFVNEGITPSPVTGPVRSPVEGYTPSPVLAGTPHPKYWTGGVPPGMDTIAVTQEDCLLWKMWSERVES